MKKVLSSMLAVGVVAAACTVYAGLPAQTGVNGSLHDMKTFNSGVPVDSMDRVCVFCHTPHFAQPMVGTDVYPLWNHQVDLAAVYTPYTWATPLNAGDGGANDFTIIGNQAVIGPSRLCLTCHDGAIAVDQHNGSVTNAFGNGSQAGVVAISARANLAKDLSDDHPIGFNYNDIRTYREAHSLSGIDALGNREIVDANTTFATDITPSAVQGTYNTVTRQLAGGRTIKDVLYQGTWMTCATCHEVHNKDNVTQENFTGVNGTDNTKAPNFFLYAKEAKSIICISCHVK